jgi:hypothetical protein
MIERALAVDEESDSKTELESMTSPSMTNQSRREQKQSPKRQQEEKLIKHRSLSLQYTTTTAESSSSRFDYV